MQSHALGFTVLMFAAGLGTAAQAQPDVPKELPMAVQLAKNQVAKHLDKIGGLKQNPTVTWVEAAALKEMFPSLTFFGVRYRKFPLAIAPPEGLSSSNLFAVGNDGKLQVVTIPDEMPKFFLTEFQATMTPVTEKNAATLVRAWLPLAQELVQDGFYSFEIVKVEVKKNAAGGLTAEGQSMVTKGGNGHISVVLQIAADGALKADQNFKLVPGPRPKCQSTKLLDSDPIVRYMAEAELLFMGLAARPYLLEQRAQAASPPLAQAIDRILQRIETVGW